MIIKTPSKQVNAKVTLGGSKSYTNRALFIAALAGGTSIIKNASLSNDTKIFLRALKKLGFEVAVSKDTVKIKGGTILNKKAKIDAHDAGTAFRFLTALCALSQKEIILTGTERMQQRPIGQLADALNKLGANISYINKEGYPPLKINKGLLAGGEVDVDGSVSSQFISALLMLGPALKKGVTVNVKGKLVSASYIDMTLSVMKQFGAKVTNKNYKKITVCPGGYKPAKYSVECDVSGASYFWAIGALNGKVRVNGVNVKSAQGDIKFADILAKMGAKVTKNIKGSYIEVARAKELKAVNVNMELMPDTAQTLAVLAAFAKGKTKITGLSTLRVKETDRLEALKNELAKMGVKTKTGKDFIEIYGGGAVSNAVIKTYKDHRMAMSFAVASARVAGMQIEEPEVVKKSFPDFWQKLKQMGF
ncbi:3-phosphoshikimate 1-carboxyvinyltransferase [Elusimicrobium posterum]|uniref:3-phosphoshikimate 1-carboxyvinyltransferase n=1 Tax=Elusimicrobium posterum TaxID=3116653 RepID=UPI003C751895